MHRKLAIVGTGTAGILSLCHMLVYMQDFVVYSINDPKIPSVGIGESANPVFWSTMFDCLGITIDELFEHNHLEATVKYGALYKNWRKEDFLNPLFGAQPHAAIHFDTFKFKEFVFEIVKEKFKDRFVELEGNVSSIKNLANSVQITIDGQTHIFEYAIDCRGFPKDKEDEYKFLEMPVNCGLVHNVPGTYSHDHWGYTLHEATQDGWMFGVPLRSRISYGYLFNNKFTSEDKARENFGALLNINTSELQNITYRFKSYHTKKLINGRVIKNGNAAVFFEPMFANSLWMHDYVNRLTVDFIREKLTTETLNYYFYNKIMVIHDFICFYYQDGSNFDTPFWKNAKEYAVKSLENSLVITEIKQMFDFIKISSTDLTYHGLSPYSISNLDNLDKFLNYNKWMTK